MTPLLTVNLLRVLFVTFCGTIGGIAGSEIYQNAVPGVVIGVVFGLLIVLADRLLKGFSLRAFSSATFGLLLGLFFANLLMASQILRYQPEMTQWAVRLIVYCAFGYLGMMLAMRSNRDEFSLIIPYVRFARETTQHEPLVVDTNIIIDGRIADLCATGFLSRALIVPRFVLGELQTLADSRDPIKRERGRRGLEILNQLQRAPDVELTIHDTTGDADLPVDARLVRIAKLLQARLLTNDGALGQVARLQQVQALNLSDLSRALRPVVLAGDELDLSLIKEGRDAHQAVGYLADGTMIVVNHGRPYLGSTRTVVVSSALQTAAGRLIFAELKTNADSRSAVHEDGVKGLRKALKYILPHGFVEVAKNRRVLRDLGGSVPAGDLWRSDWLVHEAEVSGLDLLPAGHWAGLRYVVDVGANVGQWSTMLLDLVTPERLVIIEPQPAAFAELQRQFGSRENVTLHNVAVGDVNGSTKLRVTRDTTGASVLAPREEMRDLVGQNWTVESEIEVPIKTLDVLLADAGEISLLKIDVQGFEKAVLAGAAQCLARTNFLLVELNYMPQYVGGSWFGEIHAILTRQHRFVLVDASKPLRLNGRASMSDGLYVNVERLPDFALRDFV